MLVNITAILVGFAYAFIIWATFSLLQRGQDRRTFLNTKVIGSKGRERWKRLERAI